MIPPVGRKCGAPRLRGGDPAGTPSSRTQRHARSMLAVRNRSVVRAHGVLAEGRASTGPRGRRHHAIVRYGKRGGHRSASGPDRVIQGRRQRKRAPLQREALAVAADIATSGWQETIADRAADMLGERMWKKVLPPDTVGLLRTPRGCRQGTAATKEVDS